MISMKQEPYLSINPNGRVPAIIDLNTGITLWESGAIIQYLIDTYDKTERLTINKSPDKYLLNQWLAFQISGQGPYYGQSTWFHHLHPEKIDSAIARYDEQIVRVASVLDRALQGRDYLVGDKW
jgi:glutathione S-transferase